MEGYDEAPGSSKTNRNQSLTAFSRALVVGLVRLLHLTCRGPGEVLGFIYIPVEQGGPRQYYEFVVLGPRHLCSERQLLLWRNQVTMRQERRKKPWKSQGHAEGVEVLGQCFTLQIALLSHMRCPGISHAGVGNATLPASAFFWKASLEMIYFFC